MRHLWPDELSALVDDALAGPERASAERHLAGCDRCREALGDLRANDRALALMDDPGDAYFESFAARVEDRIRAAGMRGAQHRVHAAAGLAGWFRSPRKLAGVSAVAVVVVAAGVTLWASREVERPLVSATSLSPRASDEAHVAPQEPAAPPPVVALPSGARAGGAPPPQQPIAAKPSATPAPNGAAAQNAAPATNSLERKQDVAATRQASPVASDQLARVTAQDQKDGVIERAPAPSLAPSAAAGAAAPVQRLAAAGHLQQMRRDSLTGEDVPVESPRDEALRFSSESEPQPPNGRIAKPRYAEPAGLVGAAAARRRGQLCGTITDNAGRGVPGAVVTVVGTKTSATTDHAGAFCVNVSAAHPTLDVKAGGFLPKTTTVNGQGGSVVVKLEAQPAQSTARAIAQNQGDIGAPSEQVAAAFENLPAYPRSVARNAERLTAVADRLKSAGGYDQAASEWERLLPFVQGGPLESEVRWQAASARVHAWQTGASDRRRQSATNAVVGYLAKAPVSDRRDQAQKWLDAVKK